MGLIAAHGTVTQEYVSVRTSAATGTVTDSTLYFTLPLNHFYKGIMIAVDRTAETGTCTLTVGVEFYAPNGGDWHQLENATVTFADGVTATQYLQVYPGLVGSDADSAVSLDTNEGKLSGQHLPRECRIYHTTGGTSVANTYSIDAWLLP
jgi:hypothetical protein